MDFYNPTLALLLKNNVLYFFLVSFQKDNISEILTLMKLIEYSFSVGKLRNNYSSGNVGA